MTLPLTPEMLAAAYDYLCVTPPFNKWNLPPSDEVRFRVSRFSHCGEYQPDEYGRHVIRVSCKRITRSLALIELMAHEMIHLHQRDAKMETAGVEHNKAFHKLADRVCKYHGFDRGLF